MYSIFLNKATTTYDRLNRTNTERHEALTICVSGVQNNALEATPSKHFTLKLKAQREETLIHIVLYLCID